MIISSATVRITRSICDIFMKTPYDGFMTNYTQKNRGMSFVLCLSNTKAKLAKKQYRIMYGILEEILYVYEVQK